VLKHIKTTNNVQENRRRNVISLNQPWGMSAKTASNGIQTHARTNHLLLIIRLIAELMHIYKKQLTEFT